MASKRFSRRKLFGILRVVFGVVWGIDAYFKWNPAFLNGLAGMIGSMVQGQPAIVADWMNFWIRIVALDPHLFAVGIALAESALAVALILDIFPKTALIGGFFFSLLIWSVGEGFGGPYVVGSTDIGAAVIYAFVFAALYFEKFCSDDAVATGREKEGGKQQEKNEGKKEEKSLVVKSLSLAVIVLLALLLGPYFVVRMDSEPSPGMEATSSSMSPDMMMKTFDLGAASTTDAAYASAAEAVPAVPIPTIDFDLAKDTLDGWDLHVITTNFTWTPQNINQAPVADQGHVHLYIDGVLTVLLAPWYHIPSADLPPGKHVVTVSLNANDHSIFSYEGNYIEATQTIYVSPI